jgi:hypothetical protein
LRSRKIEKEWDRILRSCSSGLMVARVLEFEKVLVSLKVVGDG